MTSHTVITNLLTFWSECINLVSLLGRITRLSTMVYFR